MVLLYLYNSNYLESATRGLRRKFKVSTSKTSTEKVLHQRSVLLSNLLEYYQFRFNCNYMLMFYDVINSTNGFSLYQVIVRAT